MGVARDQRLMRAVERPSEYRIEVDARGDQVGAVLKNRGFLGPHARHRSVRIEQPQRLDAALTSQQAADIGVIWFSEHRGITRDVRSSGRSRPEKP